MRPRTDKIPIYILVGISLVAVIFIFIELNTKVKMYAGFYQEKKTAAALTQQAFESVKEKRVGDGFLIDAINDPNETGLIGLQNSLITTEPGELSAKLTTTNPNFAAVVVELLKQAGLKESDVVLVSFSGSFPALNVAVISSCDVLKLEPIIITSVGSSMWGANDPKFTYLDMEKYLYDRGLITHRSVSASIGGVDDIGRGLSPEGRALIMKAIIRNGVDSIRTDNLEESVKLRMAIYEAQTQNRAIKAFINVGGSAVALAGAEIPSGIVDRIKFASNQGMVGEFLRRGVPVINLDDIMQLARQHDLPLAPIPLPAIGKGKIFYEARYSIAWAAIFAAILLIIIFVILRIDVDYYLRMTAGIKRTGDRDGKTDNKGV